jgi:hypothetical protein
MKNMQSFMLKHVLCAVVLAVLCTLGASRASADTVNLTYVTVGGSEAGGVYVYPYIGSLNGGVTTFDMMCLNYNIESFPGTTWSVNVSSVTGSVDDEAAALIMYDINQGILTNVGEAQFAVWNLFANVTGNGYYQANQTAINDISNAAVTDVDNNTLPPGFSYGNYVLYTPTSAGTNQDFIGPNLGPTPEPGTLMLFGTGLLGIAGFLRRKLSA